MRAYFFGEAASTRGRTSKLQEAYGKEFRALDFDVRDVDAVDSVFREYGAAIELVIHAAAQPSHDWAATEPLTDFTINANGTLNMLEATRRHAPEASFIFT